MSSGIPNFTINCCPITINPPKPESPKPYVPPSAVRMSREELLEKIRIYSTASSSRTRNFYENDQESLYDLFWIIVAMGTEKNRDVGTNRRELTGPETRQIMDRPHQE